MSDKEKAIVINKSRFFIVLVLIIVGFSIFTYGYMRSQIDIDQGGTIALLGASLFLAGIGVFTYNYKNKSCIKIENTCINDDSNRITPKD